MSRNDSVSGADDGRGRVSQRAARWLASLLIAAGLVWLLARGGLPLVPDRASLARVPLLTALGYTFGLLVTSLLRTYRWIFLLRPIAPNIRLRRVMGAGLVGFAAIFLAPLRMGEVVRPLMLSRDGEVSFLQATGTTFAERVLDGLMLTVCSAAALLTAEQISPLPSRLGDIPLPLATVPAALYSATLLFCGLFVAMTVFYVARDWARRAVEGTLGLLSSGFAAWLADVLERLADGLSFLPSRLHLLSYLGVTAAYWGLTFLSHWFLLRGSGLPISFTQATALVGVLALGVAVPGGPGLFGAFQISFFSALALFLPLALVRSDGAALVFVAYVANLVMVGVQAVLGFQLLAGAEKPHGP
jgi:glycosyltransferase 2 family protein